jgi:uncharacterized membrane protein YcaP (DUF421 family)
VPRWANREKVCLPPTGETLWNTLPSLLISSGLIFDIDWQAIFVPSLPVLEIVIRGSVIFLVLFTFIRLTLRRVGGTFGLAEILTVTLIAAAAQNAMAHDHQSVMDGLILVGTLVFWSYSLDWLGHRSPRFQRFYSPPPLPLVKDGRMLRRNMRSELITEDELMSQVRRYGIDDMADVKAAYVEADGSITVKKRKRKSKKQANP